MGGVDVGVDRRDLEWHGRQWRARVKVPQRLWSTIGKKKLVKGLGTDSLAKANILRRPVVADFHRMIAAADQEVALRAGSEASPLIQDAYYYWEELKRAIKDPSDGQVLDEDGSLVVDGVRFVRDAIGDRAEELSREGKPKDASTFYAIATGSAVPLLHYLEGWLSESTMKERQKASCRTSLRNLDRWVCAHLQTPTVQLVTRRVAGEYVSRALVDKGVHWKTANKAISACSSFWRWLIKKGHAEDNPWQGQSLRKRPTPDDEMKRPFTDAELITLLDGKPSGLLADFIRIAALSGLRIEEIAALEVRDVADGLIKVRISKTPAGVRSVPIHASLAEIIERRTHGKTARSSLFDDLREVSEGSTVERNQPVSKQFTRYRRKLGVDARVEGKRQSLVDFHSLRRWFARAAFNAIDAGAPGFSHQTVAELMGHSSGEKTLGMTIHYAGRSPLAPKRSCIEAICLPVPASDR